MDLEKKKLQFKKNDEIVITIEDLGKDGDRKSTRLNSSHIL